MQAEGRVVPVLLTKVMKTDSKKFYRIEAQQMQCLTFSGAYRKIMRPPGQLWLWDIKQRGAPLLSNKSAALWDIDDHVACLKFQSKMNTIDLDIMAMIHQTISLVSQDFKALVIYNDIPHFSAGANLDWILSTAQHSIVVTNDCIIVRGQAAFKALKYSPFPVVSAPSGLALGGGCEILLHSDAIQAHAESSIGLVETKLGLIPAWGGCKELLYRCLHLHKDQSLKTSTETSLDAILTVFETIGLARVSQSAFQARELGYLRSNDDITMN